MDHYNIHLKETKFIPDRIDPNPPKPRDPWMTFKLGDPPSTWCITPDDFEKCKWNEETMEIIRGSWNQEGEGVQKVIRREEKAPEKIPRQNKRR